MITYRPEFLSRTATPIMNMRRTFRLRISMRSSGPGGHQVEAVLAWNIRSPDNREFLPWYSAAVMDVYQSSARNCAPHSGSVEQIWKWRSSTYVAVPHTFSRPSFRGTTVPITEL